MTLQTRTADAALASLSTTHLATHFAAIQVHVDEKMGLTRRLAKAESDVLSLTDTITEITSQSRKDLEASESSKSTLEGTPHLTPDSLNEKIVYFEQRLQAAQRRMDDSSHASSVASQPLIAQIRGLEDKVRGMTSDREMVEQMLGDRVATAESKAATSSRQVLGLEAELKSVRLESTKAMDNTVGEFRGKSAELEAVKKEMIADMCVIREELAVAESRHAVQIAQWEDTVRAMQSKLDGQRTRPAFIIDTSPVPTVTPVVPITPAPERAPHATTISTLQSLVSQSKSQIAFLNLQLASLTSTLASRDVVMREMEKAAKRESEDREGVLLGMVGEREERVRELEMDVEDMRSAFRIQVVKGLN